MSCGDTYKAMVVTLGSGYTPENPYGLFALNYDYIEWRELADRMGIKMLKHLERLQAMTETSEEIDASNLLVDEVVIVQRALEGLPSVWGMLSGVQIEAGISKAVGAAMDAACAMESIDKQLRKAGVEPPSEPAGHKPKTRPADLTAVGNMVLFGGLALGGWVLFREADRR